MCTRLELKALVTSLSSHWSISRFSLKFLGIFAKETQACGVNNVSSYKNQFNNKPKLETRNRPLVRTTISLPKKFFFFYIRLISRVFLFIDGLPFSSSPLGGTTVYSHTARLIKSRLIE
jgi:hypothetical protein